MGKQTKAERMEEHRLWLWSMEQKLAYANGRLSDAKARELESIDGWIWTMTDRELKSYLIHLAKSGADKPEPNSFEGLALKRFTTK